MKLLIVIISLLTGLIAQAKIKVDISYSPIANLVYQLDCISGHLPHCSRKNYQALWDKKFLRSRKDKKAVKS